MKELRERQTTRPVAAAVILIGLALVVILLIREGYAFTWTGFGESTGPSGEVQRARTLWDWMQLLIVPAVLAGSAFFFNRARRKDERAIAEQRAQIKHEIASNRLQEEALQAYFDRIAELLLEAQLRASQPDAQAREVARVRTLTVLRRLDGTRKGILLRFLYDSELVKRDPAIRLVEADLREAGLSGADLPEVNLVESDLSRAGLSGANLSGADLSGANLTRADLSGANLSRANLSGATLKEANLTKANLKEANLIRANLSGANLAEPDLSEANLREASLAQANLFGANLSAANLSGADLSGANLSEANLREADLFGASLMRAGLSRANLSQADLREADLSGAGLSGADLDRANLLGADLSGADLSGADLKETNLFGVDLSGATVTSGQLALARLSESVIIPEGPQRDQAGRPDQMD